MRNERLRRVARWLRRQAERKVLILVYHQVTESRADPWHLNVTPSHFDEHLEVLREYAQPIKLQELSQALLNGNLPADRAVVVTFDDGYANNFYNAKPLLERYRVPATVFVASGYIGQEREFWWDELDRIFLQPGTLPEKLSLIINDDMHRWELGESAHYREDTCQRYSRWRVRKEEDPSPRHTLYRSLWELLRPMTEDGRKRVLDELLIWADLEPMARSSHRPLTLEETVTLAKGNLLEVGAHTITHPALSVLPEAAQRDEILGSKARLEELLSCRVTSFAYPYGNLSARTATIVQEAGFACACSTRADVVNFSTDRFMLPRVKVEDCHGEKFAKWLSRWLDD
jgi:peptidoglycan/xylan/chitin deacetylase (PgdA/CDA1 family)